MLRRWRKFRALPPGEQALALEAAAWLALASPLLLLLPFRHVARWLGDLDKETEVGGDPVLSRAVGRAVGRAARHLPWHPMCLPQALAARAMLWRRGIPSTLYFGVRLEGAERVMRAHAWVTTGVTGVVGVPAAGEYTVLARFFR
ncbi:lasso peptide biosynthesis B2 protein [Ferrovibrio sp.]|uniref:lasso peptide biosynthesis B2 protein n=1 Tax=Ferrovibrio sp. TaxID=1917215 RepID=UPI003D13445E